MRNLSVFLFLSLISFLTFAELEMGRDIRDIRDITIPKKVPRAPSIAVKPEAGVMTSLERFNLLTSRDKCNLRSQTTCPDFIQNLVRDDEESRIFILDSYAGTCSKPIDTQSKSTSFNNPDNLYKLLSEKEFSYLGEYTNSTVKSCLNLANNKSIESLSKFYHYSARLNEAAKKNSQERVFIAKLLNTKEPACPNVDFLFAANKVCESSKKCQQNLNLTKLANSVLQDEQIYKALLDDVKDLPNDCDQVEKCKKQKNALNTAIAGLLEMNPWFLNEEFRKSAGQKNIEERLRRFLELADKNLREQDSEIAIAAACVHGSKTFRCSLDDSRETLSSTPKFTSSDSSLSNASNSKYVYDLMAFQSCKEDATLNRNRTAHTIKMAFFDAGLGLASVGLTAFARKGIVAGTAQLTKLMGFGELANLSFDVYNLSSTSYEAAKGCFLAETTTQFKTLPEGEVCQSGAHSLSPVVRKEGSCLVNSGLTTLAALSVIPGGSKLAKLLQESEYLKSGKKIESAVSDGSTLTKTARASETAQVTKNTERASAETSKPHRRQEDLAHDAVEKQSAAKVEKTNSAPAASPSTAAAVSVVKEAPIKYTPVESIATIPNHPKEIHFQKATKADGSEVLQYKYSEKLSDGTYVSDQHDLPIDEISGGINASFTLGRELFDKLVQAKAGKAHLAFVDVGMLGKVNKEFKGGEASGDRYLKAVAEKIMKNGEGKVTLARLGGDEFGLIIDETDPKKVKAMLEKIQSELRSDLTGDAHLVFKEEKIVRAQDFRKEYEDEINRVSVNGSITQAEKDEIIASLRGKIDDLAKVQQPDISVGLIEIGHADSLPQLLERAEEQAKEMKIQSALNFGRSAEKYGSKEVPRARPSPMYKAPIAEPVASTSSVSEETSAAASDIAKASSVPDVNTLREMKYTPEEEVKHFGSVRLAKYKDELGRFSYRVQHEVIDPVTKEKQLIWSEVPTRGSTGLLDGMHPESQKLILENFKLNENTMLVMPKLTSLRYLNYFESGTKAGDQMLEAVADVIKKNMRSSDLTFKLNGADFLWSLDHVNPEQLQVMSRKINEQVLQNPQVKAILENERLAILNKLAQEKSISGEKSETVKKLNEKLEELKNFKPDLTFQSVSQKEAKDSSTLKEILKIFDDKFKTK